LSQPAGYGLANVGQYLGNAAFGGGAPTTGVNGQTTGFLSPYFGNFGGGAFNYNNTSPNANPLVAPVTGAQSNLLGQSINQANPNPWASGSANSANQFAQSNPLAYANQQNQGAGYGAWNNYGPAYAGAGNAANTANGMIGSAFPYFSSQG